ncbi:MAG: efflux RND transporter permease subunit [Spirochaetes bacterium]|nr:efflux RND transporter permease subunit [Spirochaetota bacterium]
MWEKVIEYFSRRHLLTNFIVLVVFICGIFLWHKTGKEEMPDVSFDFLRISASYPGASPEDVEHFITKPIEDEIRGVDGVYSVKSTSSVGRCSISVELEPGNPDRDETITEIKDIVLNVDLPAELPDDPSVREFKTTRRAIIDVALINTNKHLLDNESRHLLQTYALALENQLLNLSEVNSINRSGYLKPEIQIKAYPEKLIRYNIPFNKVMNEIIKNNVRQPAGSIDDKQESKVTLVAEMDNVEKFKKLIVQGTFEGQAIRLSQIAGVTNGFEKTDSIIKINGHEGLFLNVVKSSSYGILEAVDAVKATVENFQKNSLKNSPVKVVLLDNESISVRKRLSLIGTNGAIGFTLILIMLFLFLDARSSFWVAMGIPFTFCFTMIIVNLMGYTINNITLSAVIIVMGMIVDDAIVVSENISRLKSQGMAEDKAVVKGTSFVFLPVVASIVTTCVAFLPLFAFSGRFAQMTKFIPPIVFIMLGASLFESIFILPAHMNLHWPKPLRSIFAMTLQPVFQNLLGKRKQRKKENFEKRHWFHAVEDIYGKIIYRILKYKAIVFAVFFALLIISAFIFTKKMKFVLFPNEETTQLHLVGEAPEGTKRYDTADLSKPVENIFDSYMGKEVIGFRTTIAQSRRGGAVEENKMSMNIEILSREERDKTMNQLLKEWNDKLKNIKGFTKLEFSKQRWGQSSGSPIEIRIQENDNMKREKVSDMLAILMRQHKSLTNVEIERPMKNPEYKVDLQRDKVKRLGINPESIGSTLRALLEGTVLYELTGGDEKVDVRFTAIEQAKNNIYKVLNVPVENEGNYLVPLTDIVNIQKIVTPNAINREDLKRTTTIFAGINERIRQTPLEIAEYFEKNIFPRIMSQFPTTVLSFAGEVKDTRESKSDFSIAIILVIFLIYIILALLLNSLYKPIIIMMAIPFGAVGIILAFWLHGMTVFGFFAGIGALGLAGVVVNDSIVMLAKLEKEFDKKKHKELSDKQIADIAKTRLRAVLLTTLTTVAGLLPTAYGFAGYDAMLAEMMLALAWGLLFGTFITLILVPSLYSQMMDIRHWFTSAYKKMESNV